MVSDKIKKMASSWSTAREKYMKDMAMKIQELSFKHKEEAKKYAKIHKLATFATIIITFISICVIYILPNENSKDIYNVSSHGLNIIILAYLSAFNPQKRGDDFKISGSEFAKLHNKIIEQLIYHPDNRKNYERFLGELRLRIDSEIDRIDGTTAEKMMLFSLRPPDNTMGCSSTHIIDIQNNEPCN